MKELAKEIMEKRLKLLEDKQKLAEAELVKKNQELTTQLRVAEELNGDGKKVYSNDTQRKKAVDDLLSDNKGYQELTHVIKDLGVLIAREEITIEYLKNMLRIEIAENTKEIKIEVK
jgi:dynactin complex subunit